MFDPTIMTLALNLTALTTVYWVCFGVGCGLLAISIIFGSHAEADIDAAHALDAADAMHFDADFDADGALHADVGADADIGAHVEHADAVHGTVAGLSTWFSIRFLVFAVAVFGALGVILTHLSDTRAEVVLVIALAGGLAVGQLVHQLLRTLRRTSGDSTPQPQDYVNKLARVTIAITHPMKGEVALRVGRGQRYVPAMTQRPETSFNVGDQVVVVAYRAGIAEVVSCEEHEALVRRDRGGTP